MKTTFVLAISVLLSINLFAQGQRPRMPNPEERAKSTVTYLAENMKLAKQKQEAITPLFTSYYKATIEARQKQDQTGREAAKNTLEKDLKKVLTESEVKEVQKLLEEQRAKMQQQRQGEGRK